MNNNTRKDINKLITELTTTKTMPLTEVADWIDNIKAEEEEKYNNIQDTPFADSDRASVMEEAVEQLTEAEDTLRGIDEDTTAEDKQLIISDVVDCLEQAKG